jgi:Holliday junction resolvasome RuvABC endonuclease subunit
MKTLNLDPGFAWLGWSVTELGEDDTIAEMGLIRTNKSAKKTAVSSADDDFRRARDISEELLKIVRQYEVKVLCFEAASPVRSSSASRKIGMVYGVLAMLAALTGLPAVAPSPQKVRKTLGVGSKEEVAAMMFEKFRHHKPSSEAIRKFMRVWVKNAGNHNHAWDSLGVLAACVDSEVIRALRVA